MKTSAKTGKILFTIGFAVLILVSVITVVEYVLLGSRNFAWRGLFPAAILIIYGSNIVQRSKVAETTPAPLPAYVIALVIIILIALALNVALLALAMLRSTSS